MTKYVRNSAGDRVHLSTCRWATPGHVKPWHWAENQTEETIRHFAAKLGVKPCKTCKPFMA